MINSYTSARLSALTACFAACLMLFAGVALALGTLTANGTAPGGANGAKPKPCNPSNTGAITITKVTNNGTTLVEGPGNDYTVVNQGTNQAYVRFEPGSVPANGDNVAIHGTTASSGPHNCNIAFNAVP